jgi:hypothetical protein
MASDFPCMKHHALALLVSMVALASCATFDAEYRKLQAVAETKPKPDAIVGMWHRKASDGMGLQLRQSVLFRRDGTGLYSYYHRDWVIGEADQVHRFTWTYAGGGIWETRSTDFANYRGQCRVSQGRMLITGPGLGRVVLDRVSP